MIAINPLSRLSTQKTLSIKKLLRLDFDSNTTIGAPIQTNPVNNRDFKQFITRSGAPDKLVLPDHLYGTLGDNVSGRADIFLHMKPETDVFIGSSPFLSDHIENTIFPVPTDTDDSINVRSALAYDGFSTNYLEQRVKKRISGNPQCPLTIARGMTYYNGLMSEIPEIYHSCYIRTDPDINSKMVSGGYQVFGFEYKTGGLRSSTAPTVYNYGIGSFRTVLTINKFGGGIGLSLAADNNANGTGVPGLDLLPSVVNYWSINTLVGGTPDPDRPFVPGRWYKFEFYQKRSASFDDLTSGETWVALTDMLTNVRKVMLHKVGGVHKGVYGDPITRIFLSNPYSSMDTPYFTHTAGHQIWNKCPFILRPNDSILM